MVAVSARAQSVSTLPGITAGLAANSLKADVSFLASDALEGRATPSRGLDIAAEYIAAQFRRAGLEPAGNDGFFQTARYLLVTPKSDGLELTLENGTALPAARNTLAVVEPAAVDLSHAAAVKLTADNAASLGSALGGKVVFVEVPDLARVRSAERQKAADEFNRLRSAAEAGQPALLVLLDPRTNRARETPPQLRETGAPLRSPTLRVFDPAVRAAIAAAEPGPLMMTVSARIPEPSATPAAVRNVVGRLPGSDPALQESFLVISAHYDHLGVGPEGAADRIFNGANDDASGAASVIEIANALAALPEKPKRSILFVTFFGEERGLAGSRYFVAHPVVPLEAVVADINLEQMGRTDDLQGPRLRQFNATGFDFTTLMGPFRQAAAEAGVRLVKDETNSDPFFADSDNPSFAEAGIPCTTLSVTYLFPDYHMPGDEWPKLDYQNMAQVDAAVARGIWMLAEDPQAPRWNPDSAAAARYARVRPH